jgi:hypothetical protein
LQVVTEAAEVAVVVVATEAAVATKIAVAMVVAAEEVAVSQEIMRPRRFHFRLICRGFKPFEELIDKRVSKILNSN